MKKEHVHRFIWLFMAVLFIVTALGVGIYAFWVNTHNGSGQNSDYLKCPVKPVSSVQDKKNGKLQGAKLAGFTPIKHVDYLQCQDLKVGTGATATATSTVTALYTGALAKDGTIFQSTEDSGQPFTAQLNSGVIQGWAAGIPGMKVGGVRRLMIPAQYAYGAQSVAGIPAYSDLVFDITLLSVK